MYYRKVESSGNWMSLMTQAQLSIYKKKEAASVNPQVQVPTCAVDTPK